MLGYNRLQVCAGKVPQGFHVVMILSDDAAIGLIKTCLPCSGDADCKMAFPMVSGIECGRRARNFIS